MFTTQKKSVESTDSQEDPPKRLMSLVLVPPSDTSEVGEDRGHETQECAHHQCRYEEGIVGKVQRVVRKNEGRPCVVVVDDDVVVGFMFLSASLIALKFTAVPLLIFPHFS